MHMMQAIQQQEEGAQVGAHFNIDAIPDHTLGRILGLLGKQERQVTLVCRRWRRAYWSEPALWSSFDGNFDLHTWMGRPAAELLARLLAVLQRIGPTANSFALGDIGSIIAVAEAMGHRWSPAELLRCLRPQNARAVRLSTEARVLQPDDADEYRLWRFRPLPASAVRALGRLRGLTSLDLISWQLPHCTSAVLAQLTQLQHLHLHGRQLPPGCLAAVQQLADLRSLDLNTTMELGPVAQLSVLTRLTLLHLSHNNRLGVPLQPPPVACFPHLQSYLFANMRGPLQTPGGQVERAGFSASGNHEDGAQLSLGLCVFTPPITSLASLLDGLLPAGTQLRLLKVDILSLTHGQALAALRQCSQLAGLRALEINGLGCGEGEGAEVLPALLAQATALRQLTLTNFCKWEGVDALQGLAGYTGLQVLDLSSNPHLHTLPAGPYLQTVRSLNLGDTLLTHVPSALAGANALDALMLSLNPTLLTHMPPALAGANALESLVLAGCTELTLGQYEVEALMALPRLAYLDVRGVRVWPGDLVRLARERPALRIRADRRGDSWNPELAGWQQMGPPPPEEA